MGKLTVLILLSVVLAAGTCVAQYHGGSGGGYASGEYAGCLDGSSGQKHQDREIKEGSPYKGGPGGGSAFGEYTGPIDSTKSEPE